MGIYEGLYWLRKEGTIIRLRDLKHKGEMIPCGLPGFNYCVQINCYQTAEEKIKTLIHEAIHFSPEFVRAPIIDFYDQWESEIEDLTQLVFSNQPILREYLERKISKGSL